MMVSGWRANSAACHIHMARRGGRARLPVDDEIMALRLQPDGAINRLAQQPVIVAGAPLRWRGRLYNCALIIHRGRLLGVVPKTYLPNYREFYERRHFASGGFVVGEEIEVAGRLAPFGTDLLFAARDLPDFTLGVEICEDLWVPVPPSSYAALSGATLIAGSAGLSVLGWLLVPLAYAIVNSLGFFVFVATDLMRRIQGPDAAKPASSSSVWAASMSPRLT